MTSESLTRRAWLLISLPAVAGLGCASMGFESAGLPFLGEEKKSVQASPESSMSVEFHAANGKVTRTSIAVEPNDTVQSAVRKSNAAKKFRRMKLELMRRRPEGDTHKMKLDFDRAAKRVVTLHDYAIQPGDVLMVTEDTSTILDDMVKEGFGNSNPLKALGS